MGGRSYHRLLTLFVCYNFPRCSFIAVLKKLPNPKKTEDTNSWFSYPKSWAISLLMGLTPFRFSTLLRHGCIRIRENELLPAVDSQRAAVLRGNDMPSLMDEFNIYTAVRVKSTTLRRELLR